MKRTVVVVRRHGKASRLSYPKAAVHVVDKKRGTAIGCARKASKSRVPRSNCGSASPQNK